MRLARPWSRLALAAAVALAAAPMPAAAQRVRPAALTAAPARAAVPNAPRPGAAAGRRPSYARHALIGTGVGAALGLAVGVYSMRYNTGCADCFPGQAAIPVGGALAGAAVGFLGGTVVYAIRRANAARE